jgi:hypothetical protein
MTQVLDREVLELLAHDPELLALADAVVAAKVEEARPVRRTSRMLVAGLALATVIALALISPWGNGGATIVDRAIAAIGDGPVLHVITQERGPAEMTSVDLATGRRTVVSVVLEQEIWWDQARGVAHTISRTNGRLTDDMLETPAGGRSLYGPIMTCAWIARHPVEATRARVSCRFDGKNGTIPRDVPESPVSVDPALAGFLTQYRDALARGQAERAGEGKVDGEAVYWFAIPITVPVDPTAPPSPRVDERELVAVDQHTYRPVLVKTVVDGVEARSYRVVEIAGMDRADADFSTPVAPPGSAPVTYGSVVSHEAIDPSEASQGLGRPALWLGPELGDLTLREVDRQSVKTGYADSASLPPKFGNAVRFEYTDAHGAIFLLEESAQPEFAFGWGTVLRLVPEGPQEGELLIGGPGAFMVRRGVYIAIESFGAARTERAIAAAKSLVPVG